MLGAHLLFALTTGGKRVRATCRESSSKHQLEEIFNYYTNNPGELLDRIKWVEVDLLDVVALEAALDGIEQVFHCAALVSFNSGDAQLLQDMNIATTANVVNCCLEKRVQKLVHVSSVAALGRAVQGKEIAEDSAWVESRNNSPYARSKYLSELEVWRGIEEGLTAVIVNPGIILGPGNWKSGSSAVFHTVASGFKFYTEGVNGYVDARDVANAMILLMQSEVSRKRFVLVAENISYKNLFHQIAKSMNVSPPSIKAPRWMGELVWRIEGIKGFIRGKKPMVTRATARTAYQKNFYNGNSITESIDFEYRPLSETIQDFSNFYLMDKAISEK